MEGAARGEEVDWEAEGAEAEENEADDRAGEAGAEEEYK